MVAEWGLDFWAFSPALVTAPCLQGGNRTRQAEAPGIPVTDTALPALCLGPSARGAALAIRGPLSRQEPMPPPAP